MKSVVVFTAFGPEYQAMARLSARSLRDHGYEGEIVILGNARPADGEVAMLARLNIPDEVNLEDLDRLWYLDCDVAAVGPWARLEEQLGEHDLAVIADACTTKIGNPFVSGCLTEWERGHFHGRLAVNSGVMGVNLHASPWRLLWSAWRDLSLRRARELGHVDESATNAIALRWAIGHIGAPLIHYTENPASSREGAVLVHWAGGLTPAERLERMKEAS